MTAKKYGYPATTTVAQAGSAARAAKASSVTAYQGWTGDAATSGTTSRIGNSFTSAAEPTSAPARTSRLAGGSPCCFRRDRNRNMLRYLAGNDPAAQPVALRDPAVPLDETTTAATPRRM